MDILTTIKAIAALIGGGIGVFLGGVDGLVYALLALVSVDYLSGVTVAVLNRKLSSAVGMRGIAKKVFIFLLVGIANIVDTNILPSGMSPIRDAVILFYIANEGISLSENLGKLGMPLPQQFKKVLEQLKEKEE